METRIKFCIVLDGLAVFALISSALVLLGAAWVPFAAIDAFRWLFVSSLVLFSVARVCEIARVLWRTPNARSMRVVTGSTAAATVSADTSYPRAA